MRDGRAVDFVLNRALTALFGIVRTVLVIRLLTLEEYALLAIVESLRATLSLVGGLGVSDAFERDGSVETNLGAVGGLFRDAFLLLLALSGSVALLFWASADEIGNYLDLEGASSAIAIAALAIVMERLWLLFAVLIRRVRGASSFLSIGLFYSFAGVCATVVAVLGWGVNGYFTSLWIVSLGTSVFALVMVRDEFRYIFCRTTWSAWRNNAVRLWALSWTSFVYKVSTVAWRRLPLVVCSAYLEQRIVGAVSVALDLTWKLHILQQALSPLAVTRLTPIYVFRRAEYDAALTRALFEVAMWTLGALLIAVGAWTLMGELLVGSHRWHEVNRFFYPALLLDITLFAANVAFVWVLIPRRPTMASISTLVVLRFATPLLVWVALRMYGFDVLSVLWLWIGSGFLGALLLSHAAVGGNRS